MLISISTFLAIISGKGKFDFIVIQQVCEFVDPDSNKALIYDQILVFIRSCDSNKLGIYPEYSPYEVIVRVRMALVLLTSMKSKCFV